MQTSPLQEQRVRAIGLVISLVGAGGILIAFPPWSILAGIAEVHLQWHNPVEGPLALAFLGFPVTAVFTIVASFIEARFPHLRFVFLLHGALIAWCGCAIIFYWFLALFAVVLFGPNNLMINYFPCLLFPCVVGMAIGLAMLSDHQVRPRFRWRG